MNNASKKLEGPKTTEKKSAGKEAARLKKSHERKIAHMANIVMYVPTQKQMDGWMDGWAQAWMFIAKIREGRQSQE